MQLVELSFQKFKTLENFSLTFGPRLNAVRGPVGSGKTSIFQALALLKYLALGDYIGFFRQFKIEPDEFGSEENPLLQMEALFRDGKRFLSWTIHWHVPGRYTAFEKIREGPTPKTMADLLLFEKESVQFHHGDQTFGGELKCIVFRDSILNSVTNAGGESYLAIRKKLRAWARRLILLDSLTPDKLTTPYSHPCRSFGFRGLGFIGFLAGLSRRSLNQVEARMRRHDPKFMKLRPNIRPGNFVTVEYWDGNRYRNLKALGNGQLRLLALSAVPELRADLVILEELESGIPPENLSQVVEDLRKCPFQILLTSYGPIEPAGATVTHLPAIG